jgi:competence ComEA-like helix-hairpin-helix protein
MNRFFEFSRAQIKTLTILAVLVLLGGSYKFVRDYYTRPQAPTHVWRVEATDDYQPTLILDLNFAPVDSLELVPGIGPVLSQRIDDYRKMHGPFTGVDSLVNVAGIGPASLEKIRKYFKVIQR